MTTSGCYLRMTEELDLAANDRVRLLAAALAADRPDGVRELYPGYGSIYLEWDDAALGPVAIERWVEAALIAPTAEASPSRELEIPIRYDGPDLDDVLARTGLGVRELADKIGSADYRVFAVGGGPGQPLLGPAGEGLVVPRLATPRAAIEALSVGLAGRQATIYPVRMPAGWSLIGTALEHVYDPHREDPALLRHGDRIHFREASGDAPEPLEPVAILPEEPRRPVLRVEEPGALDLILDGGRLSAAQLGLAQSGPLDSSAARLANALVGNPLGGAVLEFALTGPTLTVLAPIQVALTGLGMRLEVDGQDVSWRATTIGPGSRLSIRASGDGVRGYLALAGGIETRSYKGSASVDLRGLIGRPLVSGDLLGVAGPPAGWGGAARPRPRAGGEVTIRALRGPQWTLEAERALSVDAFSVSSADRTGARLSGRCVPGAELLSESPPLGAIQVPPSGDPIVLLADRLRSAGYVKPALVHPEDISRFGQLREGERVRFRFVEEATRIWVRDV